MNPRFHIPDLYSHCALNLHLIDLIHEHPEYFYDGVEIASCYGCFPPALWNGGRTIPGRTPDSLIDTTIKAFNDRGVPIRYTFTNPTLTERDLSDPFCNKLCKKAENGFNEIIVNKDFLETYIREKFPKFPLISSTVKQIEDLETLMKEFEKDYKLVVLDYNWNNDFEKLDKIPQEYRSRCEILINPYCNPKCKRRGDHYKALGTAQRNCSTAPFPPRPGMPNPLQPSFDFVCPNTGYNFYQITGYSTFVSRENLQKYMDMGFNNFKIEGRVLSRANVVESYAYYLVKPEYRDMVRLDLLTTGKVETKPEKPAENV